MDSVTFKNQTYTLDTHGFLYPPEQWDENFAEGMAKSLGIHSGLTERHWQIIRYIRHKFIEENTVPVVVKACLDNQMSLAEIRSRFPTGYHRGACKIAGINYQFMYETNVWLTYETAPPAKPRYKLDRLGFLEDYQDWDEDFPEFMLNELKKTGGLNERHWNVIKYLRTYFDTHKILPTVFETCTENDLSLEDLRDLFPDGYRRGACRLAGLPFFG
jgi:tRNA 2-thiouridine synthesizing protein E